MTVDLTRLPISPDAWAALIDHALSLGDKCEVDYLELKGNLSFATSADRKASAVTLARAMIGMANRMPDAASVHLGGYGVILVGITEGRVSGADDVDAAVLRGALEPYLGTAGPRWQHVYTQHSDGLVLALVVYPPEWGHRMFTFRKEYDSIRDGAVFVRLPGVTRPATSSDIADLEDRRERSSNRGAEVSVSYSDPYEYVDLDNVIDWVQENVNRVRDRSIFEQDKRLLHTTPSFSALGDRRTPQEFRDEVAEWHRASSDLAAVVATEALRFKMAVGTVSVANVSAADTYLRGVRVEIDFPQNAVVLLKSDGDYCHDGDEGPGFQLFACLPKPPVEWGKYTLASMINDMPPLNRAAIPAPQVNAELGLTEHGDRYRITWDVGDLRPRATERCRELFAVFSTDAEAGELDVHWRATAQDVDHVFEGTLVISRNPGPGPELP